MARKNQEYEFDFAQKPISYRIMDGLSSLRRKDSNKKIEQDYDSIVYFKTESVKSVLGDMKYVVFYNDHSIVCPDLSPKQIKMIKDFKKGYIGYKQERDVNRGWLNKYTIVPFDRAHSYPCEINLDRLIENNMVLPLQ